MSRPYYKPIADEVEIFRAAYAQRLPMMLKGPTGSGKSRFVEFMAHELGRPLIQVSCHDETSAADLIGRFLLKGGETVWQDGPVARAVRSGAILYLDEIAEAREDVVVILHSLSDHRREIFIDRTGENLKASAEFMMVVSFNPGYQKSLKELKPSTRQRFVALDFRTPHEDVETEIVQTESGVDSKMALKLVRFANKVRGLHELGLTETVSTRLLVDAGKMINAGIGPRKSCAVSVVSPLTDDLEIQETLSEYIALSF
ncbi:MAG: CbbQ/NirQ/NorQ/GpvN family protein [Bdellovibrionaceae bacterium]|nr:CbbQ/NirQ/NorQ/GpvN family protein [Pseudobdellovibrionaceae bacterium]